MSSRIVFARLSGLKSPTKTKNQILLVNRLTKVTSDPLIQDPGAFTLLGICGNQNGRSAVPCTDQVFIEFDAGHLRHMDVSDQAGRFNKTGRSEEIRSRRESLDVVAERPHEPSHGVANVLIILNDRD